MRTSSNLIAFLFLAAPAISLAAPITYFSSDFEDGSLGGGATAISVFGTPTNISASNLDGNALEFNLDGLGDQIIWRRGSALESSQHYVGFDFWAEPGANVTQFLDVPSILRFDLSLTGRHRIDIYYDLDTQSIDSYLDGILDSSLISIAAWPADPVSSSVRIANQTGGPGNSTGKFQIDNFIWQGNVTRTAAVSEPSIIALMAAGLAGLGFARRRKKQQA